MYKFELIKTEISFGKRVTLFCNTAATLFGLKLRFICNFIQINGLKINNKSVPCFIQNFRHVFTGLLGFRKNMSLYFL